MQFLFVILCFYMFSRQTDGMLLGLELVVRLVTVAPADREWLLLKTSKFLSVCIEFISIIM